MDWRSVLPRGDEARVHNFPPNAGWFIRANEVLELVGDLAWDGPEDAPVLVVALLPPTSQVFEEWWSSIMCDDDVPGDLLLEYQVDGESVLDICVYDPKVTTPNGIFDAARNLTIYTITFDRIHIESPIHGP